MLSYWERESFFQQPDVCVIGSGIVGLATAIFIKRQNPDHHVIIAERSFLPDGASTRNAGFCCFGSVTELCDDLQKWSRENVLALAEKRFKGLELLRNLVGDRQLSYEAEGGYEVFTDKMEFERYMSEAIMLNKEFKFRIGEDVYTDTSHLIARFGFKGIVGMIRNNYEGQVDTGFMMRSLLGLARAEGIKIFYGLEVESFEDLGHNVRVLTKNKVEFSTGKLIIATNGFAAQLLPDLDIKPARAQVLVTKPLSRLKFRGSFHYDKGYYYFRNVGSDRVLFGGGRNLDFKTEETTDKGLTQLVQQRLEQLLREVILPETPFEVDMRWSGIMGVGSEKKTIVKQVSANVFCGVRMGGMGVALGSLVGKEISELVNERNVWN